MEQKLILEQNKEQELIHRFKCINNKSMGILELHKILNQIIEIRNSYNEDVTQRTLGRLLETNQRKIRRLLDWNHATQHMIDVASSNPKLTLKSMYILSECKLFNRSEPDANQEFDNLIKIPFTQIYRIGSSLRLQEMPISTYSNPFIIVRGIERGYNSLRRKLLSYDQIPKGHLPILKKILEKHKKVINCYLRKL